MENAVIHVDIERNGFNVNHPFDAMQLGANEECILF
jgi:hypothetical protein